MNTSSPSRNVCVIIAARNAADTVGRAIQSALKEPEVAEVVVVDDASVDRTRKAALAADDGSQRLAVLRLAQNSGPAFARNHGIAHSTARLISILDADDFFLRGRFDRLLTTEDWDFIADNVVFVREGTNPESLPVPQFAPEPNFLDLQTFVEGNIPRYGMQRTELGFLQPLMRRSFLNAHDLRYRGDLRLGEDYDLYARALASGARFKVVRTCGYGAVIRSNSISSQHATIDLKHLCEVDEGIMALGLPKHIEASVRKHQRSVRRRYELRRFLDTKAKGGLVAAAIHALRNPVALPAILKGIAIDKSLRLRSRIRAADVLENPRFLLPGRARA